MTGTNASVSELAVTVLDESMKMPFCRRLDEHFFALLTIRRASRAVWQCYPTDPTQLPKEFGGVQWPAKE